MNPFSIFGGYEVNTNTGPDPTHSDDTTEEDVVSDVDYDNLMNEPGPDGWEDYSFTEMYYKLQELLEKRKQENNELQAENDFRNDDVENVKLRPRPPSSYTCSFGEVSCAFGTPESPSSSSISSNIEFTNKETKINNFCDEAENNYNKTTNAYAAEYCESIVFNKPSDDKLVSYNDEYINKDELEDNQNMNQSNVNQKLSDNYGNYVTQSKLESDHCQKKFETNNNNQQEINEELISESKQEINTEFEKLKELERAIAITDMQFKERESRIEQDNDETKNEMATFDLNNNKANELIDLNDGMVELASLLKNISVEKSISQSNQSTENCSVSSTNEGSVFDIINNRYRPGKRSQNKRSRSTSKSREGVSEDEFKPPSNNDNATSSSIKDLVDQNDCNLMLTKSEIGIDNNNNHNNYCNNNENDNDNLTNNSNNNNNNNINDDNNNTIDSTSSNRELVNNITTNSNNNLNNNSNNNSNNESANSIAKRERKEIISYNSFTTNRGNNRTGMFIPVHESNHQYYCEYHQNQLFYQHQQQQQQMQRFQYHNYGYHPPSYDCGCVYCQSNFYQQQFYYQSQQFYTYNQIPVHNPPLIINNNDPMIQYTSNNSERLWANTIDDANPYYDPQTNTYFNPYKRSKSGYYLFNYHMKRP